jgi:hypothetical protein
MTTALHTSAVVKEATDKSRFIFQKNAEFSEVICRSQTGNKCGWSPHNKFFPMPPEHSAGEPEASGATCSNLYGRVELLRWR